jgi:hypothetical protein
MHPIYVYYKDTKQIRSVQHVFNLRSTDHQDPIKRG